LPEVLAVVHDVFHVSQLKKCHPGMADTPLGDTVPLDEVQLESDLTYEEKPIKILDTAERFTRSKTIRILQSSMEPPYREELHGSEKTTFVKITQTYLLATPNLEGEIHLKGVSPVTSQIFTVEILLFIMSSFIYFLHFKMISFVFHKSFHYFFQFLL
jgi:hypothetical protein